MSDALLFAGAIIALAFSLLMLDLARNTRQHFEESLCEGMTIKYVNNSKIIESTIVSVDHVSETVFLESGEILTFDHIYPAN